MSIITRIEITTFVVLAVTLMLATAFSHRSTLPTTGLRRCFTKSSLPSSSSRLFAGGFGGGGGKSIGEDKKKKPSKDGKLKPKQQWDRYQAFKLETKIRVAVRCKEDESDEWLEVGRVKTKDNKYTELAVARQRAIIAEVSGVLAFLYTEEARFFVIR
jgi:hypothetical protein